MPVPITSATITTGVTGHAWRASVTPWGQVVPWGGGAALDWWVAADDRWHVPADEPSVRQVRVEGTAVVETRVRVPSGDAVQRVFSVADAGGLTIVEVTNESPLPIAVAFGHRGLLTERPISAVPIAGAREHGIELPAAAFVVPIGHAATARVAIPHAPVSTPGALPAGLPTPEQVVRGWLTLTERASRVVLPEAWAGHSRAVTAVRCELVLGAGLPPAGDDPATFALGLGELVRMGERPDVWLPELVEAVAALGPVAGWAEDVALLAAQRVLAAADEGRAVRDLGRIVSARQWAPRPDEAPGGVAVVPWVERGLVAGGRLLPGGWPPGWLGQSWEAYGVPTVGASTVSLGVRWHGDRPAVLWEQAGQAVELQAFGWSTRERSGEALWQAP